MKVPKCWIALFSVLLSLCFIECSEIELNTSQERSGEANLEAKQESTAELPKATSISAYKQAFQSFPNRSVLTNVLNSNEFERKLLFPEVNYQEAYSFSHLLSKRGTCDLRHSNPSIGPVLSILRHRMAKKFEIDMDVFLFSHGYIAFYYHLERCNYLLGLFIEKYLHREIGDELMLLLKKDGIFGEFSFHTTMHVIKKYGVIPDVIYGGNMYQYNSPTSTVGTALSLLLLQSLSEFRAKRDAPVEELWRRKEEIMKEVYRIISIGYSEPPEKIMWSCKLKPKKKRAADDGSASANDQPNTKQIATEQTTANTVDNSPSETVATNESTVAPSNVPSESVVSETASSTVETVVVEAVSSATETTPQATVEASNSETKNETTKTAEKEEEKFSTKIKVTPLEFYKMVGIEIKDEYVTLISDSRHPYHTIYYDPFWKTVAEADHKKKFNIPLEQLVAITNDNLKARRLVYLHYAGYTEILSNDKGVMNEPYKEFETIFGIKLTTSREEFFQFHRQIDVFAGLIVGYNYDKTTDSINRYCIETTTNYKYPKFIAHASMSADFFKTFVVSVTVPLKTLPEELRNMWKNNQPVEADKTLQFIN